VPQPPHKRSLIHCDYLISLVHLRSLAATIGQAEFNRRATTYGPAALRLTWDLFSHLEFDPHGGGTPGSLASLQLVHPASEGDFVIGDHVYYWNHQAYDLLNQEIGNAWRLENTILVDRRGSTDIFLGHGSGRLTKQQLRGKLADEYNDVADRALRTAHRADRGDAAAASDMGTFFPNVKKVAGRWRVQGTTDFGVPKVRERGIEVWSDLLASASYDRSVRLWDIAAGTQTRPRGPHRRGQRRRVQHRRTPARQRQLGRVGAVCATLRRTRRCSCACASAHPSSRSRSMTARSRSDWAAPSPTSRSTTGVVSTGET